MPDDVFVTGLGIVSPAGRDTETSWSSLLAGERTVDWLGAGAETGTAGGPRGRPNAGVAPATLAASPQHLGAIVPDFAPPPGTETLDRASQFAVAATDQALRSAGIHANADSLLPPGRVSVVLGSVKPLEPSYNSYNHPKPLHTSHSLRHNIDSLNIFTGSPAQHVAERVDATGGVWAPSAACATGTCAVVRGAHLITDGDADLVICGGADSSLHPLWLAAYERLGVLANAHPERGPAWACRPFDRRRTGFAVGEGAGVLILESRASVRRRDARPMARLAGWAMGTDPAGLTRLTADGSPLAHVIRQACRRARCTPDAIGCIHAHGTATPNNDLTEARALRAALGEGLAEIPVVSIKGALGHLIGAAGAVELALSVLTVRTARSPGTATLLEADPELAALGLPREAFPMSRRAVLKTSLGFGGHLAAVVIMPA